jgi:hypothetical protein
MNDQEQKPMRLWRVERVKEKWDAWYSGNASNVCYVLATSEILAKGIALGNEFTTLVSLPQVTKKDIIVTEVDMTQPQVLTATSISGYPILLKGDV